MTRKVEVITAQELAKIYGKLSKADIPKENTIPLPEIPSELFLNEGILTPF